MILATPQLLWLGVVVALMVVLASWNHARRRGRLALFLGGDRALRRFGKPKVHRLRVERIVLLVLAALAASGAAAEPRWLAPERPVVPPPDRSFVLAIDISASMQASDVSPTRLAQAVSVARDLAAGLADDRLGMLLYAGTPYRLVPPTHEHQAVRFYLDGLVPTVASAVDPGTLLSVAIREATGAFRDIPGERSIILIGDGETPESEAAVLAEVSAAADSGVVIHVIGVGTVQGGGMVMPQTRYQFGGPVLDGSGSPANSQQNEALLRRIAEVGGGRYARADDPASVVAIQRSLQAEEAVPQQGDIDLAPWFALAALASLVLESLLDVRLPGRKVASAPRTA